MVLKTDTVTRPAKQDVLISLRTAISVPDVPAHGYPIGIDLRLDKFIATSEGELIKSHKFLKQYGAYKHLGKPQMKAPPEGWLKVLQRKLKNKKKGSRRWKEITCRIARIHEKITNHQK